MGTAADLFADTLAAAMDSAWWMIIAAYFIGCISPSSMLAKARGMDIREAGSGNAGTTNALRVMGKKAAVITLVVDIGKGAAAVGLGWVFGGKELAMICVAAVFIGHVWPVFYKFKGGKGVATLFGALTAMNWQLGLSALGIVAIGVLLSRRMSVGSVVAALLFPLLAWLLEPGFILEGTIIAVLVIIKHRSNIGRLIRGEEPKIGERKEK